MIWLRLSMVLVGLVAVLLVATVGLGIAAAILRSGDLGGAAVGCFSVGLALGPLIQITAMNAERAGALEERP